jgi:hypothetical protein
MTNMTIVDYIIHFCTLQLYCCYYLIRIIVDYLHKMYYNVINNINADMYKCCVNY